MATYATVRSGRKRLLEGIKLTIVYIVLLFGAISALIPFLWMLSTSLKVFDQIFLFPPKWIPDPITIDGYRSVLQRTYMARWFWNSGLIAMSHVAGQLLSCSLAGYAFARLDFRGRDKLFLLYLGTMMIPGQVSLIPNYVLMFKLHWVNTFQGIVVPGLLGSPFGTFLLRQFFMTIPKELEDAAFIDGASHFTVYSRVIIPLAKPALATLAVFNFMGSWNEFLWPLIMLISPTKFTVPIGLATISRGQYSTDWAISMAGALLSVIPVLIFFLAAQRYFVRGIALTGIKA